MQEQLVRLRELLDIDALCGWIGRKTQYGKRCYTDFRYTEQFLAQYAPTSNPDEVKRLLGALGAGCDCEIGFNICARLDELSGEQEVGEDDDNNS